MIAELELLPNEVVAHSYGVNRTQGRRAVGGKLHVTNLRVAFVPHSFDQKTGGLPWQVAPTEIVSVDIAPRGRNLFDGSVRRRLRITTTTSVEHFVVNRVETVSGEIAATLAGSRGV